MSSNRAKYNFKDLLDEAVREPGKISQCYFLFHEYSIGNQIAAWIQAKARGIELSPIATYKRWQELGRQVRGGEKAISLCMPVTVKVKEEKTEDDAETEKSKVVFLWRNLWFFYSQTDGETVEVNPPAEWDYKKALKKFEIKEVSFEMMNGNVQGYASKDPISGELQIAMNPMAAYYFKTMIHEIAHVVLAHLESELPRHIKELEAEAVTYLCINALNLEGAAESRGYIQHWYKGDVEESTARRIFSAADKILKAGTAE